MHKWTVVVVSWACAREVVGWKYLPQSSFPPERVGYQLLHVKPERFETPAAVGFNPGLALLPEDMAAKLIGVRAARNLTGTPKYVATFRQRGNLCEYLTSPQSEDLRQRRRLNEPGFASSVAILDENFKIVQDVVSASGELFDLARDDVRLSSGREYGNRLLTTSMNYPFIGNTKEWFAEWQVLWLDLHVHDDTGAITAEFNEVTHPDVKGGGRIIDGGRNFGVIWDGTSNSPFKMIHWLSNGMDIRPGIPSGRPQTRVQKLVGPKNKTLHNNINPISLGDACPGKLLTIGHVHLDNTFPSYRYRTNGATGSGNTYGHSFILFDEKEPYSVCAQSPPACFPSFADDSKCDTVQFVTGAIYEEPTRTLLLAYGLQDCQAAYARIPLADVFRLLFPKNDAGRLDRCSCAPAQ